MFSGVRMTTLCIRFLYANIIKIFLSQICSRNMRYIPGIQKYHCNVSAKTGIRLRHHNLYCDRFATRNMSHIMSILRTSHTILHCSPCIRYKVHHLSINCLKLLKPTPAVNEMTMIRKSFRDTAGWAPYEPTPRSVCHRERRFYERYPKHVTLLPSAVTLNTGNGTDTTRCWLDELNLRNCL